jgi:glyoxylate reductase
MSLGVIYISHLKNYNLLVKLSTSIVKDSKEVYLTRRILEPAFSLLATNYRVSIQQHNRPPTRQELRRNIRNKNGILCTLSDKIDKQVLEEAGPNLKVISSYSTGYDHIDVREATKRGIIVTTTGDVLAETTADLTFGLILAISRRIVEADEFVRKGWWKLGWMPDLFLGSDVYSSTLGILGLGRIGSAVARRAKGFNMNIIYHNRHRLDKGLEARLGIKYAELNEVFKRSDFLTIHTGLNQDSFNMIGKHEFSKMKKTAYIINTARGDIINENDLAETLRKKWIAGAALDTYTREPLTKSNKLARLKNVILLPHIGSASINTRIKMSRIAAQNLINVLEGIDPIYSVNSQAIHMRSRKLPEK